MMGDDFGLDRVLKSRGVMKYISMMINNGRVYTISDRKADIGNDGTIEVYLENASDSGYKYDIILYPVATGLITYDISYNNTENTEGSTIKGHNLRVGDSQFSGKIRETATGETGDYSQGTVFIENFVPGGETGNKVSASIVGGVSFTLPKGEDLLIRLTNKSGGQLSYMDISMMILEVDDKFKHILE